MEIVRNDDEVFDLLNECSELEEGGATNYEGMTFEQGVAYGIKWLTNLCEPHPLQD